MVQSTPPFPGPVNETKSKGNTMFIALKDLAYAKGRFFLMGLIIALVALLVVLLSGLSSGLVDMNISGLKKLDATHVAFEYNDHPSYQASMVDREMWEGWAQQKGVRRVLPIGYQTFKARGENDLPLTVSLWGVEPGSFLDPGVIEGEAISAQGRGVVITEKLLEEGVNIGDTIVLDRVHTELKVIGIAEEANIAHVPIVFAPLALWQEAAYGPPGGPAPGEKLPDILFDYATVIALQLSEGVDIKAIDDNFDTVTLERKESFKASRGYSEEVNTIGMIEFFMVIISSLVVGSFFAVWTIQRTREIGLLKALGASNLYLMKDALGQALLMLIIFIALGTGVGLAAGTYIDKTPLPFNLEAATIIKMTGLMILMGMLGAALSIRRIVSVDAIIALEGENR
jgi:putative ABC transport system permease protein